MSKSRQNLSHSDLSSQIQRMVAFIDHEAQERAEEIDCKTEGEFCYEKGRLIQQARQDMQKIYEKKEKLVLKQVQTDEAQMDNQARLRQLACREAHIARVEAEVQERLVRRFNDGNFYRELLQKLLVQGLFKLLEKTVDVRVREQDVRLIEELLEPARDHYTRVIGRKVKLTVDTSKYLPPSCLGGVELATPNRRIRIINTLHSRLQMIVRQLVPAIKKKLFDS